MSDPTFSWSRRRFLVTSAATVAGVAGSSVAWAGTGRVSGMTAPDIVVPRNGRWVDPDLQALASRAVEVAMAAGATYADVRITEDRVEEHSSVAEPPDQLERHAVGVRVLANGYWGFLSSSLWTPDEIVRLARGAVHQAKAYAAVSPGHEVDIGHIPVATGEWTTPIKYDPFDIPMGERIDYFINALSIASRSLDVKKIICGFLFHRQRKLVVSSEGASWQQTTYRTGGWFGIKIVNKYSENLPGSSVETHVLDLAGRGWEHISESRLSDMVPALIEEARGARHRTTMDVGRYDTVFSARAAAAIAGPTLGLATELDRALGYEANATGSSYLSEPIEMLGTQKVGARLLHVTANRSLEGGLSTVQWDDESVRPESFTIVKDGILTDMQTVREQVAWVDSYYRRAGIQARSHGCASSESALSITMQGAPNIEVMPGQDDIDFDDMVKGIKRGVAVLDIPPGNVRMDQQQLNGLVYAPVMRKIVDGKLGPYLDFAALAVRAPEFWAGLVAIGGPKSMTWIPMVYKKGEPEQQFYTSVGSVPITVKNVALRDLRRR
jgi:TldD protein